MLFKHNSTEHLIFAVFAALPVGKPLSSIPLEEPALNVDLSNIPDGMLGKSMSLPYCVVYFI